MQTKKKKIELNKYDIIYTKAGYELYSGEIIQIYNSTKKGIFVHFRIPILFGDNANKSCKTLVERNQYWSSVNKLLTDKVLYIKRPTCKLKLIS